MNLYLHVYLIFPVMICTKINNYLKEDTMWSSGMQFGFKYLQLFTE